MFCTEHPSLRCHHLAASCPDLAVLVLVVERRAQIIVRVQCAWMLSTQHSLLHPKEHSQKHFSLLELGLPAKSVGDVHRRDHRARMIGHSFSY
jgi:hypothetical protein